MKHDAIVYIRAAGRVWPRTANKKNESGHYKEEEEAKKKLKRENK